MTHTISENMTVYPGTDPPKLELESTYEKDGFKETLLTVSSHTGTHMDSPSHLFAGRTNLDSFKIEQFIGKALVIDCSNLKGKSKITMEYIQKVKQKVHGAQFILFYTGWDKKWGTKSYFEKYPCITEEVCNYLIYSKKKGLGLDTISVDSILDENLTIHRKLLGATDMVIIENLTGLDKLGKELFTLYALPIKYDNSDGGPARVIGVLDK